MKNVCHIFLFACLVAPSLAFYIWLQYEKQYNAKRVKTQLIAGLNSEALIPFKFNKTEIATKLHWESANEFEYNGRMYDIVVAEVLCDTVAYLCWSDDEETELNKQLTRLIAQTLGNGMQNKEQEDQLVDFFKKLYYTPALHFKIPYSLVDKTCFIAYCINYNFYCSIPPFLPPELI